jgi:hypothetical protein
LFKLAPLGIRPVEANFPEISIIKIVAGEIGWTQIGILWVGALQKQNLLRSAHGTKLPQVSMIIIVPLKIAAGQVGSAQNRPMEISLGQLGWLTLFN